MRNIELKKKEIKILLQKIQKVREQRDEIMAEKSGEPLAYFQMRSAIYLQEFQDVFFKKLREKIIHVDLSEKNKYKRNEELKKHKLYNICEHIEFLNDTLESLLYDLAEKVVYFSHIVPLTNKLASLVYDLAEKEHERRQKDD